MQDEVLETLCRSAHPNRPVGLRPLLTRAIDGLLAACPAPLLARGETAGAVLALVQRSGEEGDLRRKNSGRLPLLHLCRTVAAKIHHSPRTAAQWMTSPPTPTANGTSSPTPAASPPALRPRVPALVVAQLL